jgi:hypothetical protein
MSLLIPAFATLWLSATWLVYAFVLPLSHGERFDFNMNPVAAAIIAMIALPLIGSIVFVTSSKVIGRFGSASAVALLVISTNVFANILPSTQLTLFLPWYITFIVPAIISDILLNNRRRAETVIISSKKALIISGAIVGSIFYMINFLMLSLTFAALYGYPIPTVVQNQMSNFLLILPSVAAVTLLPGAVIGIIGAVFISRKISIPSLSLLPNQMLSSLLKQTRRN